MASEAALKQSESVVEGSSRVSSGPESTVDAGQHVPIGPEDLANCLLDYLTAHGVHSKAFAFLGALALEIQRNAQQGKSPEIGTKALYLSLNGDQPDPERASRWVSEAWKEWSKIAEERRAGLEDFARDKGLEAYPWPDRIGDGKGGAGRSTMYILRAEPLSEATATDHAPSSADIRYIRETTPKPAWWARWFFAGEVRLTGWRLALYLFPAVALLLFSLFLALLTWLELTYSANLTTGRILVSVVTVGALGYLTWRFVEGMSRLGSKRIIMAPDWLIGFHEFGVQLELTRGDGSPESRRMHLVRYASTCPQCGARLLVDSGEKEFHDRLIGRCAESPDEHVYSFDRVSRSGRSLR